VVDIMHWLLSPCKDPVLANGLLHNRDGKR
jgi:hypothetical protein